ncbi:MAG: Ig-like domain-containing protein, partial [Chloroflexota bacterium]|nr:Ig-like domain-containing protein [Chloroflexota bacterium]
MVHRSYPFLFGAVTLLTLLTHSLLGAPANKRPTVSITSPANGATFTAPANITVSANATDSDGTVSKVDFYAGATLIGTDTTAPYSIVWSNVAAGSYSLTAKATDNENATRTSSAVTITVSAATPPAPTGLAASAASSSQINLSWTDNSTNETGFRVERKLGAGGTYAEVASVGANVTTYNDTGLSTGTQYYYRVRAYNGSGNSAYSNEANATTVGTAPAAPTGLTATAGNAQVSLSWTASSGATSYKVFRATSVGGYNYGSPLASGVTTTTYIDTTAVNGTTYYYVVRATNTAGDSSSSNEVNATPNNNNTAPTVSITSPTNNATFTAPATINIEATASDADGTVSKVEFFQGTTKLGEDTTAPYNYSWNNVAAGSYSLTAKATDNLGATSTSSAVNITVNSSGGGSAATYVRTDTTTQGSWKGVYGADGYNIINDAVSYPAYAQVTPSGQPSWTWAASTGDMRALQKAATSDRIAATWYSDTGFTIDLNLTDGQTHQIALYCLDWDNGGRAQTIEIL